MIGTIGTTLDIFKKLPDGQPMWIKAVEGLDEAKRQVSELAKSSPDDYFIFDTGTGRVTTESLRAAQSSVSPGTQLRAISAEIAGQNDFRPKP